MLNEETYHTCHRCGNAVDVEYNFLVLPSVIAFDFSGHRLDINHSIKITYNSVRHKYRLAGIIYYGHGHFTTQVHQENISVLVCYFISFIVLLGSVKWQKGDSPFSSRVTNFLLFDLPFLGLNQLLFSKLKQK